MVFPVVLLLVFPVSNSAAPDGNRWGAVPAVAAKIDALAEKHWQAAGVKPAVPADDAAFLRRLTLDLTGRVPTCPEATAFSQDRSPGKRTHVIRRLMESPEYALHLGQILDEMIQEKYAGEAEFLDYMRSAVADHKPWDRIFREVMLGPWDTKQSKQADRFLAKRLSSLDDLTNDTARVFFGVNVSCAKCHDHPLVSDWTQEHYYGMASFFNPTYEGGKGKRGTGITEKATGEVTFVTTKGERRQARLMFLSSRVVEEPAAKPSALPSPASKKSAKGAATISRREQLVKVALEERAFFSRAIVNRLWAYFLGRGLVQPVDQMHSANPAVFPELLKWLAEDLASHGYDLDRLVAGVVSSQVYQRASTGTGGGAETAEKQFARASLRPLTPHQFALSMAVAVGDETFAKATEPQARTRRYRELEGQASRLINLKVLDPRTDRFQSSAGEALFMSNHADVQRLMVASGGNLAARLTATVDTGKLVDTAVWTILSRSPDAEERAYLVQWIEGRKDRPRACSQLIWALITSAEFRFNH